MYCTRLTIQIEPESLTFRDGHLFGAHSGYGFFFGADGGAGCCVFIGAPDESLISTLTVRFATRPLDERFAHFKARLAAARRRHALRLSR